MPGGGFRPLPPNLYIIRFGVFTIDPNHKSPRIDIFFERVLVMKWPKIDRHEVPIRWIDSKSSVDHDSGLKTIDLYRFVSIYIDFPIDDFRPIPGYLIGSDRIYIHILGFWLSPRIFWKVDMFSTKTQPQNFLKSEKHVEVDACPIKRRKPIPNVAHLFRRTCNIP